MAHNLITELDRQRIISAIKAAEARTAGEIYVVIDHERHEHLAASFLIAAVAALLIGWPAYLVTTWSTPTILLAQAATFAVVSVVVSFPQLHRLIVLPSFAADHARHTAERQFMAHGIHLTEARTGVLVYVGLTDRRVEIVADAGINSKVSQADWDEMARALETAARQGKLADGIVRVIKCAGDLLANHFPTLPSDRNELADRVVEI
jgi:putative membrane protein